MSLCRFAELALVVIVDAGEYALKGGIRVFKLGACLVEGGAEVGGDLLDFGPAGALGDKELVVILVLGVVAVAAQRFALLLEAVGEALEKEEAEDEVLVVGGVDRAAQNVGG
jgi:hypothetical protein